MSDIEKYVEWLWLKYRVATYQGRGFVLTRDRTVEAITQAIKDTQEAIRQKVLKHYPTSVWNSKTTKQTLEVIFECIKTAYPEVKE